MLEPHAEQDYRADQRNAGDDQQRVAQGVVVAKDEVGAQRHGGRADAEADHGDDEQVHRRRLAAHGVGHDLLDRRRADAEGHGDGEDVQGDQRQRQFAGAGQVGEIERQGQRGGDDADAQRCVAITAAVQQVRQPPAGDDADRAGHCHHRAVEHADVAGRPAVGADEERRNPRRTAVGGESQAGEAEVVAEHGAAVLANVAGHLAEWHLDAGADTLARRLADQQEHGGEQHAGCTEYEEDQLPGAHHAEHRQLHIALCRGELDHQPAEQKGQA